MGRQSAIACCISTQSQPPCCDGPVRAGGRRTHIRYYEIIYTIHHILLHLTVYKPSTLWYLHRAVYTHTLTHTPMHTHLSAPTYTVIHTHTRIHTYIQIYTRLHTHYTHLHIYTSVVHLYLHTPTQI